MADGGVSSLLVKSPPPFRAVDSVCICPRTEATGSSQKSPSDSGPFYFLPGSAQRTTSESGGGGPELNCNPSVLALSSPEPPAWPDPRLPGPLRAHGKRRGQGAAPDQGHHAG